MLIASFGESTMSITQVELWFNRFKEGRKNVTDKACPNCRQKRQKTDENSCLIMFTDILGMKSATKKKQIKKKLNKKMKFKISAHAGEVTSRLECLL